MKKAGIAAAICLFVLAVIVIFVPMWTVTFSGWSEEKAAHLEYSPAWATTPDVTIDSSDMHRPCVDAAIEARLRTAFQNQADLQIVYPERASQSKKEGGNVTIPALPQLNSYTPAVEVIIYNWPLPVERTAENDLRTQSGTYIVNLRVLSFTSGEYWSLYRYWTDHGYYESAEKIELFTEPVRSAVLYYSLSFLLMALIAAIIAGVNAIGTPTKNDILLIGLCMMASNNKEGIHEDQQGK